MLKAYLTYTVDEIAIIKLDTFSEGEARRWAIRMIRTGNAVYIGKYSVRTCLWRWTRFIPGAKATPEDPMIMQPKCIRGLLKTNATK